MRNKHYNIFAQRLSDKNIKWLKKDKQNYESWNLFFDALKKTYGDRKN